jgi:hypothetical protein
MNRNDYETKISDMLAEGPNKLLDKDPTSEVQKKANELGKEFFENGHIDENTFKFLTKNNSRCPVFYGLPKIHKSNIPLRPIVDYRNSPTYKLASPLIPILRQPLFNLL